MVLNIFQKRATGSTTSDLGHDELQTPINHHQQQHPYKPQYPIVQKAATTSLLPSPRLQKPPQEQQQQQQQQQQHITSQSQTSLQSQKPNASRRRTYISHRINLPSANKNSTPSPPINTNSNFPTIAESPKSGTTSPPSEAINDHTPGPSNPPHPPSTETNTSVTGTPSQSPNLVNTAKLKRGASPKESEVAKKTQVGNDVLNQRRARRMRARSRPNGAKPTTRRQQERRNSIASKESGGSRESVNLSRKTTNESTQLNKQQQQMRTLIDKERRRKNVHSSQLKPRLTLPYPVNDEIISIIITDEIDEPEELEGQSSEQYSDENEPYQPRSQIREESHEIDEEEFFPAGFEPINSGSFRIGNIPGNYRYSPKDSPHLSFAPSTPRDTRNEVHNDTLQQLTGRSESPPTHDSPHTNLQSFPMQPTLSEQSTYHMASDDFSISRTEAVACILERTGSTAQGSRRGQRYQEMRRNQRAQRSHVGPPQQVGGSHEESSSEYDNYRIADDIHHHDNSSNQSSNHAGAASSQTQRQSSSSRQSTIEDTRARIIARLNQRIDPTMYHNEQSTSTSAMSNGARQEEDEAPPPLDEYAHLAEDQPSTPPYRERLHKRVDLISFDPRYVTPVLRINKKLIRTPTNLRKTIRKLIQLKIVPEEIDLWKIDRIDDGQFYQVLPQLLNGDDTQEEIRAMNEAVRVARERSELEFESEIQRALAISMEEQTQRQLFHGFRYNGPSRTQNQATEPNGSGSTGRSDGQEVNNDERDRTVGGDTTDDVTDVSDVFINVDDALRIWQQQEQSPENEPNHNLQPHTMPGSFNYLAPAHANSSVSSYMTAV
ncbi:hypothetical protein CANMA_001554 [Candida margitis]|uniref:uncharacterized protein n=1 Tax=Candida margitis TaxID=1775924 RepID=UPI0022266374|nr:uncharacterized protein CANMA_001554 [Candida margitis]KAI5969486.1 hypothetical protein CANMA_001554 [Candida margitis]